MTKIGFIMFTISSIVFPFLCIFYYVIGKNINSKKWPKNKYIVLCICEGLLFLFVIGSWQTLDLALLIFNFNVLIIVELTSLIFFVLIIFNQNSEFKNLMFHRIDRKYIISALINAWPIYLEFFLLVIIKKLFKTENIDYKFGIRSNSTWNEILKESGIDYHIKVIYFIYYLFIMAFLEEYYFRYVLEYRRIKFINIIYNDKDMVKYKLEKNDYWILYSFIFALYHLTINPLKLVLLFLWSYYFYYFRKKTNNIVFVTLVHFLSNLIPFLA